MPNHTPVSFPIRSLISCCSFPSPNSQPFLVFPSFFFSSSSLSPPPSSSSSFVVVVVVREASAEGLVRIELANRHEIEAVETQEEKHKWVVRALYEALNGRDVEKVHELLAPDIEWWFHGPPSHQHMMRLLTGASPEESFEFHPLSIEAFGSTVLVEGTDRTRSVYWVHAWTVSTDGIITQVREYFNTSVTVTRVGSGDSSSITSNVPKPHCLPVWQSRLPDRAGKSLPGLVLAI